jgi:hypothetical protein
MEKIIERMFDCVEELDKFLADAKNVAYINEVIDDVNKHNDRCNEVFKRFIEETDPTKIQCYMTMMEGNLSTSIKWCCIMREAGLDACVDMLTCNVIPKCEVEDYDEMIAGKRRYNSFCHAEKD